MFLSFSGKAFFSLEKKNSLYVGKIFKHTEWDIQTTPEQIPPPLETGHSRGEIVQFMSKMHQPEYPAYEIKHNSYFTSV